jgi:hypothetical protein
MGSAVVFLHSQGSDIASIGETRMKSSGRATVLASTLAFLVLTTSSRAQTAWTTFTAKDDGFSVEVPGALQKGDTPGSYTMMTELWSFSVVVQTPAAEIRKLASDGNRASALKSLEGVRDASLTALNVTAGSSTRGEVNNYPTLRYSYGGTLEGMSMVGSTLLVLTGDHLYLVMTIGPKVAPNPHAERFLRSFRVLKMTDSGGSRAAVATANPIAARLAAPMLALAQLIAVEKLNPAMEQMLQNAPPAQGLGDAWRPSHPAWPKARAAVRSRIQPIVTLYEQTGAISQAIESKVTDLSATEAEALATVLNGPAGPAIVRGYASVTFTTIVMSDEPNGPAFSDPAFAQRMKVLRGTFNEQIGPAMPRDDGTRAADVEKYVSSASSERLLDLFQTVARGAALQLHNALTLFLFDEREAIWRDIKAAIASLK